MTEYMIRSELQRGLYVVTKWEFGDVTPSATYKVDLYPKKATCNCPSGMYRGYCKHIDMCKEEAKKYERS